MGVQTQASRQFLNRRAAQHGAVVADDDGNIFDGDVKVVEQILIGKIRVEIDVSVRMSIAGEKLAQTEASARSAVTRARSRSPRRG